MIFGVLFVLGLACIVFGRWGLYSSAGQELFPEMAGIIPAFTEILGYGLIGLSVLIPLLRKFVFKRGQRTNKTSSKGGNSDPGARPYDGPDYGRLANYGLLCLVMTSGLLFHLICVLTVDADGLYVLSIWLKASDLAWVAFGVALVIILFASILLLDFLKVHYAIRRARETSFLVLGRDLNNGTILLKPDAARGEEIVAAGSIYDQTKWFFDRLGDLEERTMIEIGPRAQERAQDLITFEELHVRRVIRFVVMELLLTAILGLIALSAIGTYLEEEASSLFVVQQAESSLMTAILWLWDMAPAQMMATLAVALALFAGLVRATASVHKTLRRKLGHRLIEKRPSDLTAGDRILGEITELALENAHSEPGSRPRRSHANLLIRFSRIFEVPVYLRVSLRDNKASRNWLKKLDHGLPYNQRFTIRDDFTLWPDDLADEDSAI
ncbi:hypothetical protein [Coralliovum pocilloporae]|uniref:hypothetical protein n=1 Tax=Coralliovum pocilloporae TaxID=3066369 RepID=UPI0033074F31